ncbi:GNAT family N-acetyltransferase [Halorubrum ezzemoulense]|uniref:GNAT family N-acetyltransferase n=1 Tax=Halorubrum ezzemoulense TaxID=337243 RepID=UPI00232D045E|nr:GNAT family N-acetyltransferase [Halorubrum ezzemoulense]MDB2259621.1 GNAT family N-acetyltransferase [Halorubrum ezzemoulense]MDB2266440.1 GNAT family N-acetyltransferase [Halorubrum ezzemoulense]
MTPTIRRLRRGDVRPLVEDLWLPFARKMARLADRNALADDVDLVAAGVEHRRDKLDDDEAVTWVAVADGETGDDARLVGYAAASPESSAPVFAVGDRLHVSELYVRPPRRGEGIGRRLLDRARGAAADRGCERVTLDVDVENESARGFYEECGFESARIRMAADPASDAD